MCTPTTNSNPQIPRLWNRFTLDDNLRGRFSDDQIQMRKKAEILQYKKNSTNISSKQLYSLKVRGKYNRKRAFATQNNGVSNPNTQNLQQEGNILIFPCDTSLKQTPVEASNVPGTGDIKHLNYDKTIPTPTMNRQVTYPSSIGDWKKLNQAKIDQYARLNNFLFV